MKNASYTQFTLWTLLVERKPKDDNCVLGPNIAQLCFKSQRLVHNYSSSISSV